METPKDQSHLSSDHTSLFESGVSDYFRDFQHRKARERVHQAWLLMSVARYIQPRFVVAELQVSRKVLRPFADLGENDSAVNFDFAVSRSEIDLRQWMTKSKEVPNTATQTLRTLGEVSVLAELKIGDSTDHKKIAKDFDKLAGAIGFMENENCTQIPSCYVILLDPNRQINMDKLNEIAWNSWSEIATRPKLLVSPSV